MARVRPFHGTRYTIPDLGPIVSPPYDVIPEEALAGYLERSPYNIVRLIRPGTDYGGAAALERSWLDSGILREDPGPAFYLHEHRFEGGLRRGLIAAVGLSPYGAGEVLPHQRTHGGAKADRLGVYPGAGLFRLRRCGECPAAPNRRRPRARPGGYLPDRRRWRAPALGCSRPHLAG